MKDVKKLKDLKISFDAVLPHLNDTEAAVFASIIDQICDRLWRESEDLSKCEKD